MRRLLIAIAAVFGIMAAPAAQAANSTVSAMTAASTLTGAELFYVVQSAADRKGTAAQVAAYNYSLMNGDATANSTGTLTFATVNSNVGSFGSTTQCVTLTVNGKGLITAASAATCTPATLTYGTNGGITLSGNGTPSYGNCFWNDINSCTTENVRGRERVFLGNAVLMTDLSSTCCSSTWLGTNSTSLSPVYLARDAQFLSMQDYGNIGISGMSRASDGGTNVRETIGTAGYALNNATSGQPATVWGGYFQCDLNTVAVTSPGCFGLEIDTVNYNANVTGDAYSPGGATTGIWLAAGGAQSPTNPSNSAITITHNGTTWNEGVILQDGSLTKDGSNNSVALAMGQGATLAWYVSPGNLGAQIRSNVSIAGDNSIIGFNNNQIAINSGTNTAFFQINHAGGGGQNGFSFNDAANGSAPVLRPIGVSDTNIGLDIHSKGTGSLRFYPGTDAAGAFKILNAALSTTYFSVDTSGGNVSFPAATTGTPATAACLDAGNNLIKSTASADCFPPQIASRTVTGSTDTILSTDLGNVVYYNSASAIAVAQPAPTGSFASGFFATLCNINAGVVTVTPGSGTIGGNATLPIGAGTASAPHCVGYQSNGTNFNLVTDGVQPGTIVPNVLGTVTTQAGTTYTFASTDCGTEVTFSNASAVTATIPQTLPAGCNIAVAQLGAGKVSVNGSAVTPATLHSAHSYTGTSAQYAVIGINVEAAGTPAVALLTGDGS